MQEDEEAVPRWSPRPSWAAAGLGGYRWDTLSSSSSSDDGSAAAALPCEQLVQQHEALQRQQQLACLPRRDKALAADPRHQAQQARLAIRGMAGGSDDETDAEEQRALALQFEQPAKKGDPNSIINVLETAQDAELDLLLLQQAQERVNMQQEAVRVARELDQQQLLALLQQQQQAAAQEQVEQSAGLFQRVTKGVLDDAFGQLKELADAQAQLSALNRHVEAIMLGYAVQALQAGSKARQAAIHQQALKEQQEAAAEQQQLLGMVLRLRQQLGLELSLADSESADLEQPAAAGSEEDEDEASAAAAAVGLPLSSARAADGSDSSSAAADDDEEFDWPDTQQLSAAPPAAALPRRRTPSPPPPLVDDSPQHTIEYITAALSQPATLGEEDPGTSGSLPNVTLLPDVITAGEEPPLSLAGYLWLERDFKPEWSQLADGRDSDERHIWHKALYDAANQALGQAYEAAGRLQLHPAVEAASGEPRAVRPLPPQPQLAAQVAGRVAGWAKQRVRDELGLDRMLGEDAQEVERSWADRRAAQAEVALAVEAAIWEGLLQDTAAVLAAM
ncbi:hypothetical protein OEZ86_013055 [Tetradesmus obliquus]|nr:hypothetical protein OEZ86_013055 [Tetradesmus obliquus]